MLYVVIGLFFGTAGAWGISRYAFTLGLVDHPNSRSSHTAPTPRGGGIGLLLAFVAAAYMLGVSWTLVLPASLLSLISFFDDRLELSPRLRLLFQFACAAAVIFGATLAEFSLLSLVFVPFWLLFIVGSTNFYNFMDGINGIAGTTGVVGFGLYALFIYVAQIESSLLLLSVVMAAACVGFLPFNLPKAKVFMGDVGSIHLGFVFACLVFYSSSDFASFLCLVTFLFPFYADALLTLCIRWRDGDRLSQAHRRHLYQVLCNELALPHWQVTCGFGIAQLLIGGIMLYCYRLGLAWQGAFLLGVSLLFVFVSLSIRQVATRS